MSSDLFFTQLVPQTFSSGSSCGNVSSSATAKQPGNTTGNHDMSGAESSFESTLQHVSDAETASNPTASSGNGQAASPEHAEQPGGLTDISQEGSPTDNLLGVSHNHLAIDDDGALDPNLSAGISMLMTILNELQSALVLNHPSGLQSGPGTNDTISVFSDTLVATGDQAATSTDSSPGMLEKLDALLKQFETVGGNRLTVEIRNLIEQFSSVSEGDSGKMLKTAEVAKLIQNLTALSSNGGQEGDRPNQIVRPADHSQTANLALNEKPGAADLAKALTTTAVSPKGSSEPIVQQGPSENLNLESNAQGKPVLTRAAAFAMPKAIPSGANAGAQMQVNEQTLSSMPEISEIKNPVPGQKEITGLQLNKGSDGGFNQDNGGPVLHTNLSARQNDATLQNAKVVHLKTDGSPTEAVAGKMVNTESGNQENGFSFTSQQQNEIKASERTYITEQSETVQKKFQTQTLDQIVQKAALHLKNGQNEVQIHLKPDFLGQIRMQIITDSQQVTVRIMTEFPMVKELIEAESKEISKHYFDNGSISRDCHPDRSADSPGFTNGG